MLFPGIIFTPSSLPSPKHSELGAFFPMSESETAVLNTMTSPAQRQVYFWFTISADFEWGFSAHRLKMGHLFRLPRLRHHASQHWGKPLMYNLNVVSRCIVRCLMPTVYKNILILMSASETAVLNTRTSSVKGLFLIHSLCRLCEKHFSEALGKNAHLFKMSRLHDDIS